MMPDSAKVSTASSAWTNAEPDTLMERVLAPAMSGCSARDRPIQTLRQWAAEIRWGKKWGKIANHEKADSHKKSSHR